MCLPPGALGADEVATVETVSTCDADFVALRGLVHAPASRAADNNATGILAVARYLIPVTVPHRRACLVEPKPGPCSANSHERDVSDPGIGARTTATQCHYQRVTRPR